MFPYATFLESNLGNLSRLRHTWKAADRQNILGTAWLKERGVVEFNIWREYASWTYMTSTKSRVCNYDRPAYPKYIT